MRIWARFSLLVAAVGLASCLPKTENLRSGKPTSDGNASSTVTDQKPDAQTPAPEAPKDKDSTSNTPGSEVVAESAPKVDPGAAQAMMDQARPEQDFASLPEKAPDQAEDSPMVENRTGFNLTTTPTIVLDKQGRDGNRYVMMSNGDFFRYIAAQNNLKCQVTTLVSDFKISMHQDDAALLYYIRTESSANNLYVLNKVTGTTTGATCPKTTATKILTNVKTISGKYKYTVVSNTSPKVTTNIVNMALSTNNNNVVDQLVGWGNVNSAYSQSGIKDYIMNECWGVETKSFNNYVAFALTNNNEIWKINGNDPVGQTKKDLKTWTSFADFKAFYKVCDLINQPPPPPPDVVAQFFHSDTCSSGSLGTVTFAGNATAATNESLCQSFKNSTTSSVWGVKINNVCYDFYDMPALDACRHSQVDPNAATTVSMFHSDTCNGSVLGFYRWVPGANIDTYCTSMTNGSSNSVWGIKAGTNSCTDIYDSSLSESCYQFRYLGDAVPAGSKSVDYYHSDSCNGAYMGRMIFSSDQTANNAACSAMASHQTPSVWGVWRGTTTPCENIVDTNFSNACANFR